MVRLNNNPFPELMTDRVHLRELRVTDIAGITILRSDPQVLKYLNRNPPSPSEIQAWTDKTMKSVENNHLIMWACEEKTTGTFIGTICFWNIESEHYRAEIGYSLLPLHQGKGYMKEIITAALKYGIDEMNLHSVVGYVNPENEPSVRSLKRAGFKKSGLLEDDHYYQGEFFSTAIYSLIDNKQDN